MHHLTNEPTNGFYIIEEVLPSTAAGLFSSIACAGREKVLLLQPSKGQR